MIVSFIYIYRIFTPHLMTALVQTSYPQMVYQCVIIGAYCTMELLYKPNTLLIYDL